MGNNREKKSLERVSVLFFVILEGRTKKEKFYFRFWRGDNPGTLGVSLHKMFNIHFGILLLVTHLPSFQKEKKIESTSDMVMMMMMMMMIL